MFFSEFHEQTKRKKRKHIETRIRSNQIYRGQTNDKPLAGTFVALCLLVVYTYENRHTKSNAFVEKTLNVTKEKKSKQNKTKAKRT